MVRQVIAVPSLSRGAIAGIPPQLAHSAVMPPFASAASSIHEELNSTQMAMAPLLKAGYEFLGMWISVMKSTRTTEVLDVSHFLDDIVRVRDHRSHEHV